MPLLKMIISENVVFLGTIPVFFISCQICAPFLGHWNFHIPSTLIVKSRWVLTHEVENIFEYILNHISFGHEFGQLTDRQGQWF